MTTPPIDPHREPGLKITQIYLAHARFDHRVPGFTISPHLQAEAALEISFEVQELQQDDGQPAVAITVGVATAEESDYPYVLDIAVTALVASEAGQENIPPVQYAAMAGAPLLYPFLREVVANVTGRGRIGPVWLKPFNVQRALQEQFGFGERKP